MAGEGFQDGLIRSKAYAAVGLDGQLFTVERAYIAATTAASVFERDMGIRRLLWCVYGTTKENCQES